MRLLLILPFLALATTVSALDRPDITFQVFQFPADRIPRVDGNTDDWSIVPESYAVGTDQLVDSTGKHTKSDPQNLQVRVRVGWVKGLNRLYFLYEAEDNYWDFAAPDLHNDTFELVVDADASGGPLVGPHQKSVWTAENIGARRAAGDPRVGDDQLRAALHGVHAQNYHVFTPAKDKSWALAWGVAPWTKEFPWANAASTHAFKPGESGRLVLEFWITPFDHASALGPEHSVESVLRENAILGLGWIVIDYDDVNARSNNGFWLLSRQRTMLGDATDLPAFRLMPLEPALRPKLQARWEFTIADQQRRVVAFRDESVGEITRRRWSFGDGATSEEEHPIHTYSRGGDYTVVLEISGPAGTSRWSRIRDVQLR